MSEWRSVCTNGERCPCGEQATHKIEETIFDDDPWPGRHPLTQYLCDAHFYDAIQPVSRRSAQRRTRGETVSETPTPGMIEAAARVLFDDGEVLEWDMTGPFAHAHYRDLATRALTTALAMRSADSPSSPPPTRTPEAA